MSKNKKSSDKNLYKIVIDEESFSFPLRSIIFNDVKKNSNKKEYKDKYSKEDHYFKITTDREYFLVSFKNLIFNEIHKRKYDIRNKDEFDDLISESYKILIELYGRMQENFKTKYADKPTIEKTKILQAFIRISYPGRLFNYWCKWRNLKYNANPNGGRGTYKKMVYGGFDYDIYNEEEFELEEGADNTHHTPAKHDTRQYDFIDSLFDVEEFSIDRINLEIFWDHVRPILNDIHYAIFEMYYKKDMSYEEIVNVLGMEKTKVTTIKWYSDQKVRKYFAQHNIFGGEDGRVR